jgi:hypothetical protein
MGHGRTVRNGHTTAGHLADKLVTVLDDIPKANLPYALDLISPDELVCWLRPA